MKQDGDKALASGLRERAVKLEDSGDVKTALLMRLAANRIESMSRTIRALYAH